METAVKGGNPMNRKTIRISEKKAADHSTEIFLKRSASLRKQSVSCGATRLWLRPVREQGGGEFAEQILADLIAQGFSGDQLLTEFKKCRKKVRPAVEAMLTQAEQAARGESESSSYEDVFGTEEE